MIELVVALALAGADQPVETGVCPVPTDQATYSPAVWAWDAVQYATSYRVYWKTLKSNPTWPNEPCVCQTNVCQVSLRNPAPGVVLYIDVTAVNVNGEGPHG